jgi:hypothetical protein
VYSYVLAGTLGAMLGGEVVFATPGSWVYKPRGEWHTSWNAGETPCRVIEVMAPAGLEDYFRDLAGVLEAADGGPPDLEGLAEVNASYGLDVDYESLPELCHRFGVTHPMA